MLMGVGVGVRPVHMTGMDMGQEVESESATLTDRRRGHIGPR